MRPFCPHTSAVFSFNNGQTQQREPAIHFLRLRHAPATLSSTFDAAEAGISPATMPPSLRHLHLLPPPLGPVMTTSLQPLPAMHEPESAIRLSTADFYFAMGTAVSCWAVGAPPVSSAPHTLDAQVLETAIASGVSHLQGLLNTTPAPRRLPVSEIVASMALEAGIEPSIAAALFVRVFADVLSVPRLKAAFEGVPLEVQQDWAADWAHLAHAAWRAQWYPELVARPAYAAGVLSGGWPCLFVAAAWVFDKAAVSPGQPAPGAAAGMSASTGPQLDPPTTWQLPARVDVMVPPNRLISDPMAYLREFQALNNKTPIPDALKHAVEEFVVTVIHHWLSTGSTPVAAWVSIPAQNPDQRLRTVTVFDHKPSVSLSPRPSLVGQSAAGPHLHEGRPIANALTA